MRRLITAAVLSLAVAGIAYATGQVSVMDPFGSRPKYLKGGTGIHISPDGTFQATGESVPTSIQPFSNISTAVRDKASFIGAVPLTTFAIYTSTHKITASYVPSGDIDGGSFTDSYAAPGIDGGSW